MTAPEENSDQFIDLKKTRAARKQHDELVSWILGQYKAIKNARTAIEGQWYVNLSFFFGKQYVVPMRTNVGGITSTRLFTPPAPYWRSRPVINRIRSTIIKDLSTLTSNRPTATVIPATAEEIDLYAAQAGEQIWQSQYIDKKLKAVIRRSVWWMLNCGTSFLKSYWDAGKGPQGDIVYTHETPFHVFVPDFREEELENQPFLIHAQVRSAEFVKFHYGKALQGKNVNAHSQDARDLFEPSFLNIIGTSALDKQHNTLILEVWAKPGALPDFPNGIFMTLVGDTIIQATEGWPFAHNKYPFAKLDYIPSGKFYATSLTEDLISLQKEYNRTRGQIIEAKNRMGKPQLMAPRGSVDASKITSEPGLVIQYQPGFNPPQPLPMQDLPSYVIQEQDRLLADWADIAGQHEVTKGQVPPGVTAATAISFLQERDESTLTPTFDSLEEAIEKIAFLTLNYVQEFWDEPRTVKVSGLDGSFDTLAFRGSDLRENTDIRIESGSSLPQSKAAKQALLMDLMKMNFIDPEKGLEVMDIGSINKIYEQILVDKKQAQRENLRMSKVTPDLLQEHIAPYQEQITLDPTFVPPLIVPVNTWDNHKVHIEIHDNFRKSQSFETLPTPLKDLFESHVREHFKALGVEQITNNPMIAAGIPPEVAMMASQMSTPPEEEQSPQQEPQQMPGPEPMPEGV